MGRIKQTLIPLIFLEIGVVIKVLQNPLEEFTFLTDIKVRG
jgi:hypothetical protein